MDVSYSSSSASSTARPLAYNDQIDDAMLQQLWLRLEQPVPEKGPGWGFRSDSVVRGADYRFIRARGLFDRQHGQLGFDPIQFYAEGNWPGHGMNLKVGRFLSPYGVESVAAPASPMFSHSYTFTYNPTSHLGALAVKTDGEWAYTLGALAGCDVFLDDANRAMLFAGVTWTEPVTAAADIVQVGSILGNSQFDVANNFNNPNIVDATWTHPIDAKFTAMLEGLVGWQSNVPGVGHASWQGLVGYLTYAATPKVTPTLRLEVFDDEDGNRTGFAGKYSEATLGLTWKLSERLTVRPEVRFDRNDSSAPWNGSDHLTTLAADVIYRW